MSLMRKNLATSVDFYLVAFFLLLLSCIINPAIARSSAYEAALPAELKTAKNMCALVACTDVFPGAKSFSERMGQPPYVEAYGDPIAGKKTCLVMSCSQPTLPTPQPILANLS